VATQAHPEFKSRPTRPHPLFFSFVAASLEYLKGERLPMDGNSDVDGAEPALLRPGSALPQWIGAHL